MLNTTFTEWLGRELETRGWTYSEVARRADLSQSMVSKVMSGRSSPGIEFCQGIARAFNILREDVFRIAGHIEPLPDINDPNIQAISDQVRRLPMDKRRELLSFINWQLRGSALHIGVTEQREAYLPKDNLDQQLLGVLSSASPEFKRTLIETARAWLQVCK